MEYAKTLPERTFLRASEVASIFGVSLWTVYSWHEAGKIEGVKIGRSLRLYRKSVEKRLWAKPREGEDRTNGDRP